MRQAITRLCNAIPRNRVEISISVFCKQYYEQGEIYFGGNQRVSGSSKGVADLYTLIPYNIYPFGTFLCVQ
jgi:hypothetical protein